MFYCLLHAVLYVLHGLCIWQFTVWKGFCLWNQERLAITVVLSPLMLCVFCLKGNYRFWCQPCQMAYFTFLLLIANPRCYKCTCLCLGMSTVCTVGSLSINVRHLCQIGNNELQWKEIGCATTGRWLRMRPSTGCRQSRESAFSHTMLVSEIYWSWGTSCPSRALFLGCFPMQAWHILDMVPNQSLTLKR